MAREETTIIPIDAETNNAAAKFQDLADTILETEKSAQKANPQLQALGEVIAEASKEARDGRGYDELKNRVRSAMDTMQEFGGTLEESADSVNVMEQAAKKLFGGSLAPAAKIMERFADEAETGKVGMDAYTETIRIASLTHERLEDATNLAAKALSGNVEVLEKLDGPAQAAAKEIAQLADKEERARLIQLELNRAQARANSISRKLGDRYRSLKVQAGGLVTVFKGAAGAAGILGGVLGGAVLTSIKHYIEKSAGMQKQTKRLSSAFDELKFQFGGAIVAGGKTGGMLDTLTGQVRKATAWVKENQAQIAEWARMALMGGAQVVKGGAHIILGLAMFATATVEGIQEIVRKGMAPIMEVIADNAFLLKELGIITPETAGELAQLANGLKKISSAPVSMPMTEKLAGLLETIKGATDGFTDSLSKANKEGKKFDIGPKVKSGGGGGGKKEYDDYTLRYAEDTARYTTALGGLQVAMEQLEPSLKDAEASGLGFNLALDGIVAKAKAISTGVGLKQEIADVAMVVTGATSQINMMKESIKGALELADKYKQTWDVVGKAIGDLGKRTNVVAVGMASDIGQAIGAGFATGQFENFGDMIRQSLATGLQSIIPIVNTAAAAILGLQTLNPLAALAATAVLGALVGGISTALAPQSRPGGAGSAGFDGASAVREEARALRDVASDKESTTVVIAQFGTERFEALASRAQRNSNRNGLGSTQEARPAV